MRRSTRPPPSIEPSREELKLLAGIHSILGALNDHAVGVNQIARHVEGLPSLAGRVILAAEHELWDREIESVHHALAILGNRGFERVLLEYLEALTILKSDVDEEEREAIVTRRANALRSR